MNMKPNLLIKFPTRGRPEKFKRTLDQHIAMLSGSQRVRFVITMDEDDQTMNTREMRDWLDQRRVDLVYHYGQSKSKIEAVNADLKGEQADVLLVTSDDMWPIVRGYDQVIVDTMRGHFPDFWGAVRFWDGRKPVDFPLMTLPVIGWPLYEAIGHVYHPDYLSVYADNEQTELCTLLGCMVLDAQCVIEHQWPGRFDPLSLKNESVDMYGHDERVNNRRKAAGYGLENVRRSRLIGEFERLASEAQSDERTTPAVCFCLWGALPMYTQGALENARMLSKFYPGWRAIFYVFNDVPSEIVDQLGKFPGVEIRRVRCAGDSRGMFFRFLPALGRSRMVSRDTDSRPSNRESGAVNDWAAKGTDLHVMRDHPQHGVPILGGMWGVLPGKLTALVNEAKKFMGEARKGLDQEFLSSYVHRFVTQGQLTRTVHDPQFDKIPFPSEPSADDPVRFVGQIFDVQPQPKTPACRSRPKPGEQYYDFSTHLDVLGAICTHYAQSIPVAVEYGPGLFSTPLLIAGAKRLISVEQGQNVPDKLNAEWAEKIKREFESCEHWEFIHLVNVPDWRNIQPGMGDLVFVDGRGQTRADIVQRELDAKSTTVVAHDTEEPSYGWARIKVPHGYREICHRQHKQWTTAWTVDNALADALLKLPAAVETVADPIWAGQWWQEDLGFPFISGLGWASQCGITHVRVGPSVGFKKNPRRSDRLCFCHPDHLAHFFAHLAPSHPFTLVTAFSAYSVDEAQRKYLDDPRVLRWYGANAILEHPKLRPIPIGIPDYHHPANRDATPDNYLEVIGEQHEKSILVSATYKPTTNPGDRNSCTRCTGIAPAWQMPRKDYMRVLAKSRFTLSPRGVGIDCHRHWEALYNRCVPIITRNRLSDRGLFDGLPVVILEKWEDFRIEDFTPERHEELMRGFDPFGMPLQRWIPEIGAADEPTDMSQIFGAIYAADTWGGGSGTGSTPAYTAKWRDWLAGYIKEHHVRSILDIGCGDWQSTRLMDLEGVFYTGIDPAAGVIAENQRKFARPGVVFRNANAIDHAFPVVDLVIVKDVLEHLSFDSIGKILAKLDGCAHVLIVDDVFELPNQDKPDGGCSGVDVRKPPFNRQAEVVFTFDNRIKTCLRLAKAR